MLTGFRTGFFRENHKKKPPHHEGEDRDGEEAQPVTQ